MVAWYRLIRVLVARFESVRRLEVRFVKQSRIAAPAARVFAFHESPGAVARLTPPWEPVVLVEGGDSLRPGSRVVLEMRIGPARVRWIAQHTEYEAGRLFADTQLRGPFAHWNHRHWFLDDASGGTLLRDEVDFDPPLGPLGRWLTGSWLQSKLRRLFDFRHEATRRIVESGDFPGATS